ncbi:hypothetical protein ABIC75_000299 [Dyella japonica]|uniref:Uncharacterized protein n=1 Tax=Dyella japonica TaxID=231455 RepID=A0ABV2JPS6_9GAMM
MHLRSWHNMGGRAERRIYANGFAVFLFTTVASSIALLVNWGGSPDPLVIWICGVSSMLLLFVCIARWKR